MTDEIDISNLGFVMTDKYSSCYFQQKTRNLSLKHACIVRLEYLVTSLPPCSIFTNVLYR